jgi:PD-(D/E)XK nuclease superfamily protein
MIEYTDISTLLAAAQRILDDQKQTERKQEQFNVFSVLRMDRSENKTHTAFLSELLHPKGSHKKGPTFLKLFLELVKLDNYLTIDSADVKLEFTIGERNDVEKKGGRVDILITDGNNKAITIENKIDADDQYMQIERYCNYNKGENQVFYLTLDGREPSPESKGNLVSGKDFQLLSFRNDIVNWLERCLKEAEQTPLLRASIKQYIMLIKKMTNSPDSQHEEQLIELLKANYESAAFVSSSIVKARQRISDSVRHAVFEKLKFRLPQGLTVAIGENIHNMYAQIWVRHTIYQAAQLQFGIESFNGTGNNGGNLFIGVFNRNRTSNIYTNQFDRKTDHWYEKKFLEYEGAPINFSNNSLIVKIQNEQGFKDVLTDQIVIQSLDYILKANEKLSLHLQAIHSKGN